MNDYIFMKFGKKPFLYLVVLHGMSWLVFSEMRMFAGPLVGGRIFRR